MKLKFFPLFKDEGELIAGWGEAQLIRYLDGKVELRGGTKEDRIEAREWISLFWHEAVVGMAPHLPLFRHHRLPAVHSSSILRSSAVCLCRLSGVM